MGQDIFITKASGEKSKYSEEKIRTSLKRVGANEEQIDTIIDQVAAQLYEGIPTKKIYKLAFNLLKEGSRHLAARYHLKQAIMELGPSGYPFEKYFSEILKKQGFETQVGMIVQGNCVTHEIDVIAKKENKVFVVECKYHNLRGIFCDVKIPLYINSRFLDVEKEWLKTLENKSTVHQGWLVTNTRFSSDAIQYGVCAGLKLLGWDYPVNESLKDQIDALGLYPITCLTSLTKTEKQRLLDMKFQITKNYY